MKKKLIILIGIALVLIGIIGGSSFAYFTITDSNGNENVITSGTMALNLTDGQQITVNNLAPGEYLEKEFSVTNTGNVNASYDIYLSEVVNEFADKTDLVYELISLDGGYNTQNQIQVPDVSTKIINQQIILPSATHHYKLKITFLNKQENQNDNMNKFFMAKIQINTYENINTTVKYYLDNVEVANLPTQISSNYISSSCNNNVNITFNTTTWTYQISNLNQNNTTCNIYFETATVTVTYNAGDGSVNPTSEDVTYGGTLTLPTPTAPTGYDFAGWYTGANGTGTQITNATVWTSSQTIYAYWLEIYKDNSGASYPELYQGLIPVKYNSNGDTVVADLSEEWYDYDEHEWANAVLVTSTAIDKEAGETLSDSEILQYYVWIPRYKYKLWNANNGSSNEQMIEIEFQDKNDTKATGSTNNTWLTHPAFTFGNTELNGIWVGKFEMTGGVSTQGNPTNLTILPNEISLRNMTVGAMFNSLRNQDITYASSYGLNTNEIDTHMMKNMEWGAVAYLSSSKYGRYIDSSTCVTGGCEIWINPNSSFTTGCAGSAVSEQSSAVCNTWYSTNGKHASTTDNQYGIYDISGCAWEYTMGNVNMSSTYTWNIGLSELQEPEIRYYDAYTNNTNNYYGAAHTNGKLGDATKETLKVFGNSTGGWFSDISAFPYQATPWMRRGGGSGGNTESGAFQFRNDSGGAQNYGSYRAILTEQDGNFNGNGLS